MLIRNAALFKAVSSEELNDQQFTGIEVHECWRTHHAPHYIFSAVKIFLNESNVESFRAAVETSEQRSITG